MKLYTDDRLSSFGYIGLWSDTILGYLLESNREMNKWINAIPKNDNEVYRCLDSIRKLYQKMSYGDDSKSSDMKQLHVFLAHRF